MKIRYTRSMAGPGVFVRAGDVADVAKAQAEALVSRGYAEAVGGKAEAASLELPEKLETATAEPDVEQAVSKKRPAKRKAKTKGN